MEILIILAVCANIALISYISIGVNKKLKILEDKLTYMQSTISDISVDLDFLRIDNNKLNDIQTLLEKDKEWSGLNMEQYREKYNNEIANKKVGDED